MTAGAEGAVTSAPPRGTGLPVLGAFLGGLLVLVGAYGFGLMSAGLGWSSSVAPAPDRVIEADPLTLGWIECFGACAIGLGLLAAPGANGRRAAPSPIVGCVWVTGWTLLFSWVGGGLQFVQRDATCTYSSCWPLHWQQLAITIPLFVACLALLAVGTVLHRRPRWLRMVIPALTFLVLTAVQRLLWDGVVMPFFAGPPPWWA